MWILVSEGSEEQGGQIWPFDEFPWQNTGLDVIGAIGVCQAACRIYAKRGL